MTLAKPLAFVAATPGGEAQYDQGKAPDEAYPIIRGKQALKMANRVFGVYAD